MEWTQNGRWSFHVTQQEQELALWLLSLSPKLSFTNYLISTLYACSRSRQGPLTYLRTVEQNFHICRSDRSLTGMTEVESCDYHRHIRNNLKGKNLPLRVICDMIRNRKSKLLDCRQILYRWGSPKALKDLVKYYWSVSWIGDLELPIFPTRWEAWKCCNEIKTQFLW